MRTKKLPGGIRETNLEEAEKMRRCYDAFSIICREQGYKRVDFPILCYYELFQGKAWIEDQEIIKLIDYDGKILSLRPDMTILAARYAALNHDNEEQMKLFYEGKVFRNSFNSQINREENQFGLEIFGPKGAETDCELISGCYNLLRKVGATDLKIFVGHSRILRGLLRALKLNEDLVNKLILVLNQRRFREADEMLCDIEGGDRIMELIGQLDRADSIDTAIETIREIASHISDEDNNYSRTFELIESLEEMKKQGMDSYIKCDLLDSGGFKYYDGLVFSAYCREGVGKIAKGGRYDSLMESLGRPMGAGGFAVYWDVLRKKEELLC